MNAPARSFAAAQRRAVDDYAKRNGQTISREYIEEGCSGVNALVARAFEDADPRALDRVIDLAERVLALDLSDLRAQA